MLTKCAAYHAIDGEWRAAARSSPTTPAFSARTRPHIAPFTTAQRAQACQWGMGQPVSRTRSPELRNGPPLEHQQFKSRNDGHRTQLFGQLYVAQQAQRQFVEADAVEVLFSVHEDGFHLHRRYASQDVVHARFNEHLSRINRDGQLFALA